MISDSAMSLQYGFGLKKVRPGHQSPPHQVSTLMADSESDSFFVTIFLPQYPAARVTLCQWFSKVLLGWWGQALELLRGWLEWLWPQRC